MAAIGGINFVKDGLVLYLDAANKKSYPGTGTVCKDLSGNGNDGTNDTSVIFNPYHINYTTTNKTSVGNTVNLQDNLTISSWVRFDDYRLDTYSQNFISKHNGTSTSNFMFYFGGSHNTNKLNVYATSGGVWKGVTVRSKPLELGLWYYVTWTYNDGGLLYINGEVQGKKVGSGLLSLNTTNILLGKLDGAIVSFQIYDKALSNEEVHQNYNVTKSRFGIQ